MEWKPEQKKTAARLALCAGGAAVLLGAAEKLSAKAEKALQRRREQHAHERNVRRGGKAKKPYIPTRIKREQQSK